jgi:hypothetical protein
MGLFITHMAIRIAKTVRFLEEVLPSIHYATNRNVAGSIPDSVIGINSLT